MPCLSHASWLHQEYELWSSLVFSFLQPPATSSLVGNSDINSLVFFADVNHSGTIEKKDFELAIEVSYFCEFHPSRRDDGTENTHFTVTIATESWSLTHMNKVLYVISQREAILFQGIVSILWALVIFYCRYLKFSILYRADCLRFIIYIIRRRLKTPASTYHSVASRTGKEYGRK
jgi:hypothetical protein